MLRIALGDKWFLLSYSIGIGVKFQVRLGFRYSIRDYVFM